MTTMLSEISRIEVFSSWVGFADPPSQSEKLTVTRVGTRFVRQQALQTTSDEVPEVVVLRVMAALERPLILQLDPSRFDVPAHAIQAHYDSGWDDDNPRLLVRIELDSGRFIKVGTDSQYAFMLPLRIRDSAQAAAVETFDPELSRALAALMPDGFLNRNRLGGHSGMLDWKLEQATGCEEEEVSKPSEAIEETVQNDRAPEPGSGQATPSQDLAVRDVASEQPSEPKRREEMIAGILRIFSRQETLEAARALEESGSFSKRLLKRLNAETIKELLARGADPSVADEGGQTALMHAAFPPFDAEQFFMLVEAGAEVEARCDGVTGLHKACLGGGEVEVKAWVQAGADVNARCPEGATPLMFASSRPENVRTLLKAGADVHAIDFYRNNALTYAIVNQCHIDAKKELEAIQTLIAAGANVNQRDYLGVSLLQYARKKLAEVLIDHEVTLAFNPKAKLSRGKKWNDRNLAEAIVRLLLAFGAHE